MEEFVKGDVVVIPFPYSDLSSSKRRPALVISNLDRNDLLLCQITSKQRYDNYSVLLKSADFKIGKLDIESFVRPNKIFTADKSIIEYKIDSIKINKLNEIIEVVINLLRQ